MDRRVGYIIGGVFVLALFLWIFFSLRGLVNQSKMVYLYNPLEVKLNVDIDDEHYELSPNALKGIEISKGNHSVKSKLTNDVIWDTTIQITSSFLEKGGVINLSGEPMYKWYESYGSSAIEDIYDIANDSASTVKSPLEQRREQSSELFNIDTTWLYGMVEVYPRDQLVLKKTWDYNAVQDFEDVISAGDDVYVGLGTTASKLFGKEALLKYWYENYPPIVLLEE